MSKQTDFTRYSIIYRTLKKGDATFKQIAAVLDKAAELRGDDGLGISLRTFQREIKNLEKQFNVEIENRKTGERKYFLKEENLGEIERQLLESYEMLDIVKAADLYREHIYFETRKPKGLEIFFDLLQSIRNKKVIKFSHFKYQKEAAIERMVHPLALKEANGLWYLLAFDTKDNRLKSFGLDRINELEIEESVFRNKYDFNFVAFFDHSFGIISHPENTKIERVVLSFTREQGLYVKNFPLHHSQKAKEQVDDRIAIELSIFITHDFIMELLKYGDTLKVISPMHLRKKITAIFSKALKQYEQ